MEERILHYQSTRKGIGYYHQQYQLKELFKTEGFEYMKCVPAQARPDVLKRLYKTYTSLSFECESCGHTDNADHNASKNIMGDGIALSHQRTTAVAA